jgi:hypothetical protein
MDALRKIIEEKIITVAIGPTIVGVLREINIQADLTQRLPF